MKEFYYYVVVSDFFIQALSNGWLNLGLIFLNHTVKWLLIQIRQLG